MKTYSLIISLFEYVNLILNVLSSNIVYIVDPALFYIPFINEKLLCRHQAKPFSKTSREIYSTDYKNPLHLNMEDRYVWQIGDKSIPRFYYLSQPRCCRFFVFIDKNHMYFNMKTAR